MGLECPATDFFDLARDLNPESYNCISAMISGVLFLGRTMFRLSHQEWQEHGTQSFNMINCAVIWKGSRKTFSISILLVVQGKGSKKIGDCEYLTGIYACNRQASK